MMKIGEKGMPLTNGEQKIKNWAEGHVTEAAKKGILPNPDDMMTSYWIKHDSENDISEYGFDTMPEFENAMKSSIGVDIADISKSITVEAFKSKERLGKSTECENDKKDKLNVPDFIYVF